MKKLVSAILSVLFALNICAICAMADNEDNADTPSRDPVQSENTYADSQDSLNDAESAGNPDMSERVEPEPVSNATPGVPYITKDPLGETVKEGGEVVFIVKAEQVEYYVWEFISPDSQTVFAAGNVNERFKNVKIEGVGTDTIVIKNVPLRMDGWRVLCRLKGTRSNVNSQQARIRVISATPLSPKISEMPSGGKCEMGRSFVLSVKAREVNENGVLNYQWYKIDRDSNSGGQAISGENSASLSVPQKLGTAYYYVEVWSTVDGEQSPRSVSTACAVTYEEAKEPLPTEEPEEEENHAWDDEEAGINWLLIAFIAISLLAAAVAGFMVYTIIDDKRKEKQSSQTEPVSADALEAAPAAPESDESGAEPAPENIAAEAVEETQKALEQVQPAEEVKPEAPAPERVESATDANKEPEKPVKNVREAFFGRRRPKPAIQEEAEPVRSDEPSEPKQHELEYRSRVDELAKLLEELDK